MEEYTPSVEEMFITVFCILDDLYKQLVPECVMHRSQHKRIECSDSEILTLSVMQEALSNDSEGSFHRYVCKNFLHLFPKLPSRDRYHRRRKALLEVELLLFRHLAQQLDAPAQWLILDSAPVETVLFVRSQSGLVSIPEAAYGYCAAKKRHFFGFRLHGLITDQGAILDFALSAANIDERSVAKELLRLQQDRFILSDNGFSGEEMARSAARRGNHLWSSPKQSKAPKTREEAKLRRWLRSKRDLVETVFSMLAEQFKLETTKARSLWGLKTRIAAKLLSFNLSLFINKTLGRPLLAVKSLYL